ncbi:MAG: outer membrane protein transport protein [Pirellulaceae bacterium]|nr:outer membrane protein transport protein [Pirellulaceae bacterium]
MNLRTAALLLSLVVLSSRGLHAQSFGVEVFNNLMPASGGMAGASIASPQDLQSAINGNPATLTQYRGTQFGLGGAWIEPTYNISVAEDLLFVGAYDAKSDAQGIAAPNIGVTQDFTAWGLPMTIGLGLMAGSGAGVDFREVPASRGTYASLVALDIVAAAGVSLTDRLSFGASLILSNATMGGPIVGITGSSIDYALRGSFGFNYQLTPDTNLGFFWKSKANQSLLDGRLLLALDAVYQQYSDTAMFGDLFNDQWAVQLGAQYALNPRVRLRVGYAWNENPMRDSVGSGLGGVPVVAAQVQYIEALFAAIPQDRITGGVSIRDVLPGVDLDLFAGGMFEESQTFGVTTATVESYWVGTGVTWRFGRGGCAEDECK